MTPRTDVTLAKVALLGDRGVPTEVARRAARGSPTSRGRLVIVQRMALVGRERAARRALVELSHPNLAEVHEVVDEGRTVALVSAYVEGESLAALREVGALPLAVELRIALDVLEGLGALHALVARDPAAPKLHGQLDPRNVIVGPDGRATIVQLGGPPPLVAEHPMYRYLAPETLLADETADHRVDVYSVGALLWEALTGAPFVTETSPNGILVRHLSGKIGAPTTPADAPWAAPLASLAGRAVSTDPATRFESAAAFAAAIRAAVGEHVAGAAAVAALVEARGGAKLEARRRRFAPDESDAGPHSAPASRRVTVPTPPPMPVPEALVRLAKPAPADASSAITKPTIEKPPAPSPSSAAAATTKPTVEPLRTPAPAQTAASAPAAAPAPATAAAPAAAAPIPRAPPPKFSAPKGGRAVTAIAIAPPKAPSPTLPKPPARPASKPASVPPPPRSEPPPLDFEVELAPPSAPPAPLPAPLHASPAAPAQRPPFVATPAPTAAIEPIAPIAEIEPIAPVVAREPIAPMLPIVPPAAPTTEAPLVPFVTAPAATPAAELAAGPRASATSAPWLEEPPTALRAPVDPPLDFATPAPIGPVFAEPAARLLTPGGVDGPSVAPSVAPPSERRRRGPVLLALGVLALVALAAGGLGLRGSRPSGASTEPTRPPAGAATTKQPVTAGPREDMSAKNGSTTAAPTTFDPSAAAASDAGEVASAAPSTSASAAPLDARPPPPVAPTRDAPPTTDKRPPTKPASTYDPLGI